MTVTIKICGLRTAATLDAALDAGADMVGFVFFEASPRHLSLLDGRALARRVEGRAGKVALTADADDATLAAVVEALSPDILQLHGNETPERLRSIRMRFGVPVMRAIAVADTADLDTVAAFDAACDHLIFDARAPTGASRPGGNGRTFDWTVLKGARTRCPWLVAGGLHAGNVATALERSGAYGVDVSSGVESAPGVKDPAAIARFVAAARAVPAAV